MSYIGQTCFRCKKVFVEGQAVEEVELVVGEARPLNEEELARPEGERPAIEKAPKHEACK